MKTGKILILLCALMLMATAVSATQFSGVFYKDMSDSRVKLFVDWPASIVSNVQLGSDVTSFAEFDKAADLSQAIGSAYSSIKTIHLYSSQTDFFTLVGSTNNTANVKTKEVWLLPSDFGNFKVFYKDMSDSRVKLFADWPSNIVSNVQLGSDVTSFAEFDKAADLSQAIGSAYSSIKTIHLYSSQTDFFTLVGSTNNTANVKTKEAWIYTYPPATAPATPPATEEQITPAEVTQAAEEVTGTDMPPEVEQAITAESSNATSPAFVLAKLLVMEKTVKKVRTTRVYVTNKATMEPLLKDIEKQISVLKSIAGTELKIRMAELSKAKGVALKSTKVGVFRRAFRTTGNFFTGMAVIMRTQATTSAAASTGSDQGQIRVDQGQIRVLENQLGLLAKNPLFANKKNAQAAITKIKADVAKLKDIVTGKKTATPVRKGFSLSRR